MKEKEMKKKYESGNYIIIKLIDDGWSYEWKKTDSLYNGINTKEMKLIHKKHEEVLNAWLMDNDSIIIRIKSHLGSYLELDFIGTYDESNNYSLDEAPLFTKEPEQTLEDLKKEKFAKFGFEVKEGIELFTSKNEGFKFEVFGIVREGELGMSTYISMTWSKDGMAYDNEGKCFKEFDLTPIKKPWYENPDNFPKLMFDGSRRFLSQNKANYLYALELGHRLATNEEIDNLKCKG